MDIDYSLLDRPEIRSVMFYPRQDRSPAPPGSQEIMVEVEPGVQVHCRWHPAGGADTPAILFFHGNGEVVADYDDIAMVYRQIGVGLFAADYRGYGRGNGTPGLGSMLRDALLISDRFHAFLDEAGITGARFIMGRSLGALSAVEIAARQPERFKGLILESGAAGIRGWSRFARPDDDPAAWERLREAQIEKMGTVRLPLLTIHGEWDELIPVQSALDVQAALGSVEKDLVVIPHAGHNDLLAVGIQQYFDAVSRFVEGWSAA